MNSFEEYTVIIGVLAIALEGISYVRDYLRKLFHHS
jgi:hypothetical protein